MPRISKTILKNNKGASAPFVMLEACAVHAYGCRACKIRKYGPCNCGAEELWERVKDRLIKIVEEAEVEE